MTRPFVNVREVGLRDGLQMLDGVVPTDIKLAWLRAEAGAGVSSFEVTSFVSRARMPQFADAEIVAAAAREIPGIDAGALALNGRGADRALEAGVSTLIFVLSASLSHSQGNAGRSTDAALAEFAEVAAQARRLPLERRPRILAGVATAFGCTLDGSIDPQRVRGIAQRLAQAGADEIALADTVGVAHPDQVRELCKQVLTDIHPLPLGAHFHDTRGLGLANVAAALDSGVRSFDAALGGLGGCPFAPGASGNIATEDLVYLLATLGYETGIDLPRLLDVRAQVQQMLPQAALAGAIARAGIPRHQESLFRQAA